MLFFLNLSNTSVYMLVHTLLWRVEITVQCIALVVSKENVCEDILLRVLKVCRTDN